MRHFDLIVIGTGSGNALPQSLADLDIAICEEGRFGGTCLNVGCIPTKMFVHPADVIVEAREAGKLGAHLTFDGVDLKTVQERVFARRIDPIADAGEAYRRTGSPNVTVYDGHARFVAPKTIDTGTGERITADQIVIAAGSRPHIPAFVADSGVRYHTNDTIMRVEERPERLIILGSGYIGCEFAHVFSAFGTKVTIVGRSGVLLKHQDRTISERFTEVAAKRWDVRLGAQATSVRQDGDEITLTFADGESLTGDALLVATGRTPNGDRMNLPAGGIEMHDDGRIRVDEHGRTSAEGVWALGDVSSPYQLKHVANYEAKVVFHNVTHPAKLRTISHHAVPAAVFTYPQIASVGLTEDEAREAGYDIAVSVRDFGDVAFGWAMEDTEGLCKIVADRATGTILGAHLIGHQSSVLIQGLIQAMALGTTVTEMAEGQYWIHPALSEVVENALLGLEL